MNWLKSLFGLGEVAGEFFKERQRLKSELKLAQLQGKIDLAKAEAQAKIMQQEHVQTWEQTYVNAQASSKKDEVVLAVVIPVVQDYILTGFQYLNEMPYWAVGLTVTIFLAIYGIRHRNASKINAPGLRDKDVSDEPKPAS